MGAADWYTRDAETSLLCPGLRTCVFGTRSPVSAVMRALPGFPRLLKQPCRMSVSIPFLPMKKGGLAWPRSLPRAWAAVAVVEFECMCHPHQSFWLSPSLARPLCLPYPFPLFSFGTSFSYRPLFRKRSVASDDLWQLSFVTHVLPLTLGRTLHSGPCPPGREEGSVHSRRPCGGGSCSRTVQQARLWRSTGWGLICAPSVGTGHLDVAVLEEVAAGTAPCQSLGGGRVLLITFQWQRQVY